MQLAIKPRIEKTYSSFINDLKNKDINKSIKNDNSSIRHTNFRVI